MNSHILPMDVSELLKNHKSPRQRLDFFTWQPEKNGQFTLKSAYRLVTVDHDKAFSEGASSSSSGMIIMVLYLKVVGSTQKVKITVWKAAIAPTRHWLRAAHASMLVV